MVTNTGIQHWSHPHKLIQETRMTIYSCDGCKEPGTGPKYRCASCGYDLHKECALALPSTRHPSFTDNTFQLLAQPPPPGNRSCDSCDNPVLGLMYHCARTGRDLHPCCLTIPGLGGHVPSPVNGLPSFQYRLTDVQSSTDLFTSSLSNLIAESNDEKSNQVFASIIAREKTNQEVLAKFQTAPSYDPNSLFGACYNQAMANITPGLTAANSNRMPNAPYPSPPPPGASSIPSFDSILSGLTRDSNEMPNLPYTPPQVASFDSILAGITGGLHGMPNISHTPLNLDAISSSLGGATSDQVMSSFRDPRYKYVGRRNATSDQISNII